MNGESRSAALTERGRQQVLATAQQLKQLATRYPVDAFYASPLPRAQSTADAIAQTI
ncbi:MAG: phosphoglycerate mutase family protein, partial [Actinomycetota bacterium]